MLLPQPHANQAHVVTDVDFPQHGVSWLFSGQEPVARSIEKAVQPFHLELSRWSSGVRVSGGELSTTIGKKILSNLSVVLQSGHQNDIALVSNTIADVVSHQLKFNEVYHLPGIPHPLRPMTLSQVAFLNGILYSESNLIFGMGPTGTGKTYLAIAGGLDLVNEAHFKKLVITRPRVSLEGEIMTPALRADTVYDEQFAPIEDTLSDLLGHDEMRRRFDHGLIEIVPVGRLRGRTFNDCVIVIDEAQNMTIRKMRMALTRIGRGSRMIVIGDPNQSDLADNELSGLHHILPLICEAKLALIHRFDERQIVRNEIVAKIDALYRQSDAPILRDVA